MRGCESAGLYRSSWLHRRRGAGAVAGAGRVVRSFGCQRTRSPRGVHIELYHVDGSTVNRYGLNLILILFSSFPAPGRWNHNYRYVSYLADRCRRVDTGGARRGARICVYAHGSLRIENRLITDRLTAHCVLAHGSRPESAPICKHIQNRKCFPGDS